MPQTAKKKSLSAKAHTDKHKPVPADTGDHRQRTRWLVAGVLIITAIVFAPSLKNGITNWDDDLYITENPLLQNPGTNFADFFTTDVAGNFHPLTMLSFATEYALFGENPVVFHLTNLLLHLLNTLLVFLLIWQLTGHNRFISLFTALVFGIHPMHVESVTWISERKDVLYTFFFLLSLLAYLNPKQLSFRKYLLVFALFLLSCLAKSAAVVLPLVLILLDVFRKQFSWKKVAYLIPFFIVSLLVGLKALDTQSESSALGDVGFFSFYEKIRFASYGFIIYIVKFFVPFGLSAFHPYPKDGIPVFYDLSVVLVIALFVGAFLLYRRNRVLLTGLLFYGITIALVLQFITVGNAVIAERYTYVPYIGIGLIMGSFLSRLQATGFKLQAMNGPPSASRLPAKSKHVGIKNILAYALTAAYLLAMAVITFDRTKVWKDSYVLWTDVIGKYPLEDGAYINRGHFLRSVNQHDRAIVDYEKAMELNPKNFRSYHNRGKILFDRGEVDRAMADFNRSIELNPNNAEAYSNRCAAYGMKKEYENALLDVNRAIELDPSRKASYSNRAVINYETQRYDDAITDINLFLTFEPNDADMINLRALCHRLTGRLQEAIGDYSLAIQLNPKQPAFYLNRSYAYMASGDKANALADALQAQKLGMNIEESYLNALK